MLIHSYLTDGFVKMAEVFLKSLKQVTYPRCPRVWLETRNLTAEDFSSLRNCYLRDYLHINNSLINISEWAGRAGVSPKVLLQYKRECESQYVSQRNRVWKLMTAGEDRIRALYDVLFVIPETDIFRDFIKGTGYVAHFDIDTLFRKRIDVIQRMMDLTDIWLKLRLKHRVPKARITIDCILVRPTDEVKSFFDMWIHYLDILPPKARPIGYGQLSCLLAFEKVKEKLDYRKLPHIFGLPGRNKDDQIIWCGNVHKLAKDDCVEMFKKEAGL